MTDTTVRIVFEDKGGGSGGSGGGGGGVPAPKPAAKPAKGKRGILTDTPIGDKLGSALQSLQKLKSVLTSLPVVGKKIKGTFDFLEGAAKKLGVTPGPTPTGKVVSPRPRKKGPQPRPSVAEARPREKGFRPRSFVAEKRTGVTPGPVGADKIADPRLRKSQPRPTTTAPQPTKKPVPAAKGTGVGKVAAGAAVGQSGVSAATGAITKGVGAAAGTGTAGGAGAVVATGAGATGGVAGAAALLGPVGIAIVGLVAVVGASVLATKLLIRSNNKLRDQFKERARQFAPFSRDIALQQAQSNVAQLRQDITFARRLGPRTATFNKAQDRIARAADRISLAIDEIKLDTLTPLIQLAATGVENAANIAQAVSALNSLVKRAVSQVIDLQKLTQKEAERQNNKLPPEADILGAFNREGDLTVEWNNNIWGDDEKLGRNLIRGARFEGLPEIAIP